MTTQKSASTTKNNFRSHRKSPVLLARNTAIEHAQGELILPLDADDRLAPHYCVERMVQIFEKQQSAGIVMAKLNCLGSIQ